MGKFIAIDGLDGSGKGTQSEKLVERLRGEGKRVRVLCDGPSKTDKGMLSGRTSENKIVFFPDDGTPQGEFIEIEIDRAAPFALYGKHV